jgi:hypothetical protein
MATTTTTTSAAPGLTSALPTTNNYELDYSPPNSNTSTLRQKFMSISNNNSNNSNSNKNNIATATIINANVNYNFTSPQHHNNDSGFNDTTITGTPNSFLNNTSSHNVNSIANNFANMSVTQTPFTNNFKEILNQTNLNNSTSVASGGTDNKCLRCGNQVYSLERIGPIKGNIYHKTCFKCLACDRQLDLKTYYTNQVNLNDRQIYCQSHAPKSGKGVFGADNIYIHNILNAPKLDVMQKVDNKPKVSSEIAFFLD